MKGMGIAALLLIFSLASFGFGDTEGSASTPDHNTYLPWNGCSCKYADDKRLKGHCFCPPNTKMSVYCRADKELRVCFPFGDAPFTIITRS